MWDSESRGTKRRQDRGDERENQPDWGGAEREQSGDRISPYEGLNAGLTIAISLDLLNTFHHLGPMQEGPMWPSKGGSLNCFPLPSAPR